MSRAIHVFRSPDRFVAGTVGQPGNRTFYLQAVHDARVVSVVLEKQQVAVLAERIENYREHCTVLQKLPGRSALKTLVAELETYAGSELEADL